MKLTLWAAACASLWLCAPASAEELFPAFKLPFFERSTPAYGWDGLYSGLNAGYAGAANNTITSNATNLFT